MSEENAAFSETPVTPVPEAESAAPPAAAGLGDYSSDNVQIFRDAAHIRQRPGMYIGDSSTKGLHHLVYELVYNSVDEALAGHCKNIIVKINVDGSLSVGDDGRGIPVDEHPEAHRPTLEVVMTTVGAGAKFDKNTYKVSAGLHGIGAKAVTALSQWVEACVHRNGREYIQEYERGKPSTEVMERGLVKGTGTRITFKPDPEIFQNASFDYDTLEDRLRELAFLNKGLHIKLVDERSLKEESFKYDGGIGEYVEYLNRSEEVLHKPLYVDKTMDSVKVEVALQYHSGEDERVRCYANNANNKDGGTHMVGFRTALTRALNGYGDKQGLFKNDLKPIGEDFREGLTAVVSVQVPEPQLESQTKVRLNNPEVEGIVANVVNEFLGKYLEENPKDAARIMKKVITAAEAREAAAKAKKALKDRKSILNSGGLPGKLMDCTTRDRDTSELFLVEGDSAGGSAESGRDRRFQAILPLRGKVLNVEKARLEKVVGNDELASLISAVGIDIGNSEDVSRLRYGKVVILTDADVDGQHIRTLLLTFFYRQMRKLIENGRIYIARPPLFKVTQKKSIRYVKTAAEMGTELMKRGMDGTLLEVFDTSGREVAATYEGARLTQLVQALSEIEESLLILERRGQNLAGFLKRSADGKLPTCRVVIGTAEHWFPSEKKFDEYRREQEEKQGKSWHVADEVAGPAGTSPVNGQGESYSLQVFHEVDTINRQLPKLAELGLGSETLVDVPRVAGREPPPRFVLVNGESRRPLTNLRELVAEIRRLGERGWNITRFKGLGEMEPEELWDTTLDPGKRTLVKVHLDDGFKADEMFRILMGDKVEPRRDFIQKHALEVVDIDYHGA